MSDRIDIAFNDARRRLNLVLIRGRGILPLAWVKWGRLLHGPDIMTHHEFPPWNERSRWYIDQVELFVEEANAYIDRDLAPYANSKPRKVA